MSSWSYKEPLTHSYLLPYVRMIVALLPPGSKVWLQTSEKVHLQLEGEEFLNLKNDLSKEGIHWLPFSYAPFGLKAFPRYLKLVWKLHRIVKNEKIDFLHPFAPGAGTTAVMVELFSDVKIVMDSWEPHAESMVESGVWNRSSLAFKIMWWAEKRLTKRAYYLIAASKGMVQYASEKWNFIPKNIAYRPACVNTITMDPSRFDKIPLRKQFGLEGKIVCVCTGKLDGMYMGEETFQIFSSCFKVWGEKFHALLLTETSKLLIDTLAEKSGLPQFAFSVQHVSFEDIPRFLSMADFAFNPQKPLPSKRFGTPVKDGEYWAMGLPVVIHNDISEDSAIVRIENIGAILGDLSHEDNLRVIAEIEMLMKDVETRVRCRNAALTYRSFDLAEKAYRKIYLQE
jgi:hypothetical protein